MGSHSSKTNKEAVDSVSPSTCNLQNTVNHNTSDNKYKNSQSHNNNYHRRPKRPKHFAEDKGDGDHRSTSVSNVLKPPLHHLVMHRQSSMYFDEDGDLAHEFYEEVKEGQTCRIRKKVDNLTPQGIVQLPYPRLHNDCPTILYVL